ncbi:hypothetical protein GGX14DRAFT_605359 [Mycena pura]|uniref:Uncharacterized protein n=1 Tax=Mycena pura TaxID=153505 RepID=A0AAD6VN48_9AGAR|nr:hypothetical protein GGX14DRAFT_605359 [Mycena pura]
MIPLRGALHSNLRLTSLRSAFRPGPFRLQTRQYLHTSRPSIWTEKIWFRADGAPRSKARGLAITLGCLYVGWQTSNEPASEESLANTALTAEKISATLMALQRIDSEEYASVDFSRYPASLDYFARLYQTFHDKLRKPKPRQHNRFFAKLASLDSSEDAKRRIEAYASLSDPEDTERLVEWFTLIFSGSENAERRVKAYAIMREAAETVHEILAVNQLYAITPAAAETAYDSLEEMRRMGHVSNVLFDAVEKLCDLLDDASDKNLALILVQERVNGQDAEEQVLG